MIDYVLWHIYCSSDQDLCVNTDMVIGYTHTRTHIQLGYVFIDGKYIIWIIHFETLGSV